MESFSHEEFITAMRMQGKDVAVTPESIQKIQKLRQNGSSSTVKDRWSRAVEEEDIEKERMLREERKRHQSQIDDEVRLRKQLALNSSEPRNEEGQTKVCGPHSMDTVQLCSITDLVPNNEHLVELEEMNLTVEMWWLGHIDLDLSCIVLNEKGNQIGLFFFGEQCLGQAFKHSGDMMSAPGPNGARESICVALQSLPPDVAFVYFVMSSFSNEDCSLVEKLVIRVVDGENSRVISGVNCTSMAQHRAAALCRLCKNGARFELQIIDGLFFATGDTVRSLSKQIQEHARHSAVK